MKIVKQNFITIRPTDTGAYVEIQNESVELVKSLTEDLSSGVITIAFSEGSLEFVTPNSIAFNATELDINVGEVKKQKKEKPAITPVSENEKTAFNKQITELNNANQKLRQEADTADAASKQRIAELETKVAELTQMLEQVTAPADDSLSGGATDTVTGSDKDANTVIDAGKSKS